mgnify:CR=1 FL=1
MNLNQFTFSILSLCLLLSIQIYAQSEFESGYFIDNQDEKKYCLIKNERWEKNPEQFKYKLDNDTGVKIGKLSDIKMFAVEGVFKYVRASVKIDTETDGFVDFDNNQNLNYREKELYLNKVVEGKVSLYHYQKEELDIFFISKRDSDVIEQLIFKRYRNEDYKEGTNKKFRGQIYEAFDSSRFSRGDFKRLDYNLRELKDIFVKYNKSFSDFSVNYQRFKLEFNVYAKLGANLSSFFVEGGDGLFEADFSDEINITPGAEFELQMPFSKGKWSLFTSPSYQSYSSKLDSESLAIPENPQNNDEDINNIDYSSLLIPLGFRRYFMKKESDFRFYANAAYVFDVTINDDLVLQGDDFKIKPTRGFNIMLGGGVQFDRYGVEFLYFTDKDLIEDNIDFDSEFETLAINLTYKIF